MATTSTGAAVSMADVYALLLADIRKNRAARLAAQTRPDADQSSGADEAQQPDQAVGNDAQ